MNKFILLLLIPCAGKSQSGIEILKLSAEKISSLKNISYNVYTENAHEKITADVTIERGGTYSLYDGCRLKVKGIALSDHGSEQISFSYNGSSFDYMDIKTLELVKLENPDYKKIGRTGMILYDQLIPAPYWQKIPFDNILKQLTHAEVLTDSTIYSKPCYRIKVSMEINSDAMGKLKLESVWFIDKETQLICGQQTKTGKVFIKIKTVNEKLNDNYFNLVSSSIKTITGLEAKIDGLLATGTKAPEWILPSSKGSNISLKEQRGKVVLLDFWGTWCVPCLKAMPDIQAIHETFKDQPVEIIGVSVETESKADPLGYVKRKGYTYTIVTEGDKITKHYKVAQFPTVYVIDKNGIIIHAEHSGNRENFKEDLIDKIKNALK
jgi:peroxiredoxin